jgi:alpha-galactosidase
MSAATREILNNREVIAVDQDPLGRQAQRRAAQAGIEIWSRPLAAGGLAVGIFNRNDQESPAALSWAQFGLPAKPKALRDLWQHCDLEPAADGWQGRIPAHGVVLLIVK